MSLPDGRDNENIVEIRVDTGLYPAQVVRRAALTLLDDYKVDMAEPEGTQVKVMIRTEPGGEPAARRAFFSQLLLYWLNDHMYRTNGGLVGLLSQTALSVTTEAMDSVKAALREMYPEPETTETGETPQPQQQPQSCSMEDRPRTVRSGCDEELRSAWVHVEHHSYLAPILMERMNQVSGYEAATVRCHSSGRITVSGRALEDVTPQELEGRFVALIREFVPEEPATGDDDK